MSRFTNAIDKYLDTHPKLTIGLAIAIPLYLFCFFQICGNYHIPATIGILLALSVFFCFLIGMYLYAYLAMRYLLRRLDVSLAEFSKNPIAHIVMIGFSLFSIFAYPSMIPVRNAIVGHLFISVAVFIVFTCLFIGVMHEKKTGRNKFEEWMKTSPMPVKILLGVAAFASIPYFFLGELFFIIIDIIVLVQTAYYIVNFIIDIF
ncbi:MAG: hypothetical protein Q8P20_07505 [bacterium]|nr:hypothetical protein [bacterium]